VRRLSFVNNVFYDIQKVPWANWDGVDRIGGNFLYMTQGPIDVTFDHNTVLNGRTPIIVDTPEYPTTNFVFKNNIAAHNTYGIFSSEGGTGNKTIVGPFTANNITYDGYFNDNPAVAPSRLTKNVLMGGNANSYSSRPGNYFPAAWSNVGFVDQANGNYRLASTSPYKNAGTDGKDLGANIGTIASLTAASISGADVAPYVAQTFFEWDAARQALSVHFSESMLGLTASDAVISNVNTGATFAATLSYDDANHVARVTFPGLPQGALPDGNYNLSIDAGAATDQSSNGLSPALSFDFFVLAADANHDRTVDTLDFNALAANFGQTGRTPSGGDFNYDGVVDTLDFNLLASRFGSSLVPPADSALAAAAPAQAKSPFSAHPIEADSLGLPTDAGEAPLI
jgi:hypothetical protein